MTSKLGIHIIEPKRQRAYDQAIVQAKPRVVKVLGAHNELGILSYYHEKNPSAMYIARIWDYEKAISDMLATCKSALDAASMMYNALHQFVHAASMEWCWFECGVNEPNIDEDDDVLAWIDDYYALLVPMLAADGIRSVSYNFSVCHPEFLAWPKLSRSLAVIRKAGPQWACVGLHEYGGINGDIRTDADTQILRHRRIPELQRIPIVVTESGREPGWQQVHRGTDGYYADLLWLDEELQKDGNVIGACLYTVDADPAWKPFRIEGDLAIKLFNHITKENASGIEVPPEPEQEPTEGTYTVGNCKALNVRMGPGVSKTKLGSIPTGTIVKVVEVSGDWAKIVPVIEADNWVCIDYLKETK